MKPELKYFKTDDFHAALRTFFKSLNIPVNYIAEESVRPLDILEKSYKKDHPAHQLMEDVYFLGMVDDHAFAGNASLAPEKIASDYDGILIFGATLNQRENGLLPTRSQLAEITRSFNREFCYTPVVVVFKYENNNKSYIAFANAERLKYKQEWREGEKAGKVSLLRDIDLDNPHSGHLQILSELAISRSGKKAVNSFTDLYTYWQTVFNVSLLNKKFYEELSNWYFWAIKEVTFPSQPTLNEIIKETGKKDNQRLEDSIHEHNAKNVIRLLTRFLFVWFIKEKNLIPEELFNLEYLKSEILNDFSPYHVDDKNTLFELINIDTKSNYYKAILQNLFFATLNCPLEKKAGKDKRNRGFSKKNFGVLHLMRYEKKFKNSDLFLEMMNNNVPFLNGGLFECLDKRGEREKREERLYIDGFSDNLPKEHDLIVPDYLFFGLDEKVDLSSVVGIKNKKTEQAVVKGLINIFKSYKFTIAENTPIEEDIALDPELLGKVFENLLASYNPETKTTARKQTGSFYTPREIVNYMVDESLIAYLKNAVKEWDMSEDELDNKLHQLLSFDPVTPFENDQSLQKEIIKALDHCTILDPACGSGAFPMGILQKMVHVLQKVDPLNSYWQELQMEKALQETESIFRLADKETRKQKLIEINEAFDTQINDPDYARKLFLIENCIYGVDIQPIAAQISKLRFFISLVVDQKVDNTKENFGIRPLPNLETKFVAANTLIGIEKPEKQGNLFTNTEINELEEKLKVVRHRIFSIKKPQRKKELRQEDQVLREKMGNLLVADGWQSKSARQLAGWDPYDQNASSAFFDPEWMFGITDGFDVVIGNPPYIKEYTDRSAFKAIKGQKYYQGEMDIWYYFACIVIDILKENGLMTFIATNNWTTNSGATILRNKIVKETKIEKLLDFNSYMIFESAAIQTMILISRKRKFDNYIIDYRKIEADKATLQTVNALLKKENNDNNIIEEFKFVKEKWIDKSLIFKTSNIERILDKIQHKINFNLNAKKEVATGIDVHQDFLNKKNQQKLGNEYSIGEGIFNITTAEKQNLNLSQKELELIRPFYTTNELGRYYGSSQNSLWLIYTSSTFKDGQHIKPYPNLKTHLDRFKGVITSDNKPYGLHRARIESFFKGEKIISLRKCPTEPSFTYTDFDCYVSQTFFVIKTSRINQKYLVALLNSSLVAFWLRHKGKMQGAAYQIDKGPILEIPIFCPEKQIQTLVSLLVNCIICCKKEKLNLKSKIFEQIIDGTVFQLYFPDHMQKKQIDILQFVEKDIAKVIQAREFEQLLDSEKENIINQLHAKWTHPDSEVRNRIKLFAVRSPEILKPILESR